MDNSPTSSEIRILIIDDHPVVRDGLSSMLARAPGMNVVAAVALGSDAIELLRHATVDIALVDLRMPGMSGVECIRELHRVSPKTKSIVLSSFESGEEIYLAVDAGASGYLLKEMDSEVILRGIREVFCGGSCFPDSITQRLAERKRRVDLSPREKEILELVVKGFTNKEIASALRLSQFTVRNHLNHLCSKLQVSDRTEATFVAIQTGLVIVPQ